MIRSEEKRISEDIKVSIIVLAYNHEKYIRQALDGILMQRVDFKYEILVGDDASQDGTQSILLDYQKKYGDIVKLHLRENNIGPTQNAYKLFLAAQGEYIATCEGDDFWTDPEKLKKQIDFLDNNPDYIGCSHPCRIVDSNGEPIASQRLRWECRKRTITLKDYKGYYLPGQASTLVRRNLYRKNCNIDFSFFYKAHRFIGDRTTALIYLSQGNFYRFSKTMGCYRVSRDGKSVTAKLYRDNNDWLEEDLSFTKKLMEFAEKELKATVDFHPYLSGLYVSAWIQTFKKKDKASFQLSREVLKVAPNKWKLLFCAPAVFIKKSRNLFGTI